MDQRQTEGILKPLLILLALVIFMGFSPQVSLELKKGYWAASSGNYIEASDHIAQAAKRLPWRGDLWEKAGRYALQAGNPQVAIQYFTPLVKASQPSQNGFPASKLPNDQPRLSVQGLVLLGDAYQEVGDLPAAIHAWQRAIEESGPTPELMQRLFQAHLALNDYGSARADIQLLSILQPTDAQIIYQLSLLTAIEQPEEALTNLNQVATLQPDLSNQVQTLRRAILSARISDDPAYSLVMVGRALASIGEWELAEAAFENAVISRPDYAEAWAYLGESKQHTNPIKSSQSGSVEDQRGLPELQKAIELSPKSLAANTLLAIYWMRHGRYDLALQAIQLAIQIEPQNPLLQVELGNMLAASGELSAACEAYYKAISLAPLGATYLQYLAEFSIKYSYHVDEIALPAARKAVILMPQNPAYLDLMAQVFLKLGDLASAERFLDRALQADPNYAPAHLHLGLLFLHRGDMKNAYLRLRLALSLAADTPTGDQALRLLETNFPEGTPH